MDIESIKAFYLTASLKNITRASEHLHLTRSAISKQIQVLEKEIGVKLLDRYHTGIELTEEGCLFFEFAKTVCEGVEGIKYQIKATQSKEDGVLKIITLTTIGGQWFSEHVPEFIEIFPEIQLEVIFEDRQSLELSRANTGVYVGLTNIRPSDKTFYVVHKLARYFLYPYAHPTYLEKRGVPRTFADLERHNLVGYKFNHEFSHIVDQQINCLRFLGRRKDDPLLTSISTDDAVGCREMVKNGAGIAMLPRYLVKDTDLVEVLQECYQPEYGGEYNIYLLYPQHLKYYSRVKAFKDFVVKKIQESPYFMSA